MYVQNIYTMKRHRVIKGRSADFSRSEDLDCKNERDPFSFDYFTDIPRDRIYRDSSGECYDKHQLQQFIIHQLEGGLQPTWPQGALVRQQISREVFRDLDIDRLMAERREREAEEQRRREEEQRRQEEERLQRIRTELQRVNYNFTPRQNSDIDPSRQRDYTNEFTDRERFIAQYHAQLQDFDEDEYDRLNAPPHYNMQALLREGRVQSSDIRDLVRDRLLPLGMPAQFARLYDDDD